MKVKDMKDWLDTFSDDVEVQCETMDLLGCGWVSSMRKVSKRNSEFVSGDDREYLLLYSESSDDL